MNHPTEHPQQHKEHQALEPNAIGPEQPAVVSDLREVIREQRGCEAKYCRTVYVPEKFAPDARWDGFVKVFDLLDHPAAQCCYAWSYHDGGQLKHRAVLGLAPVDSPKSAVRSAG